MKEKKVMINVKKRILMFFLFFALLLLLPMMVVNAQGLDVEGDNTGCQHEDFTYSKSDNNQLIAKCTSCNETVNLTLSITKDNTIVKEDNEIIYGEDYEVDLTDDNGNSWLEKFSEPIYYDINSGEKKTTISNNETKKDGGKPKKSGKYRVKVEFNNGNENLEISKDFNICEHDHKWSYSKGNEENKITAKCIGNGTCGYEEQTVNITLNANDTECSNGEYKGVFIEVSIPEQSMFNKDISLKYYLESGTPTTKSNSGSSEEGGAPKKGGVYYVEAKFSGVSAKKSFTINHAGKEKKEPYRAATCTTEGYTGNIICEKCEGIISKGTKISIDPTNHEGEEKTVNIKEATCTTEGYTGDVICSSCSNKKKYGSVIKSKGYKWDVGKITKQSTDTAEGQFTYTCTNGCRHTKTEIIPRKSITVDLGKKAEIISDSSAASKMTLASASKYKKYLTFNTKTGEIKTKKYYKVKISKSIPVKVTIGGKEYTVKIKIKIPAPKAKEVKITKAKKGANYRYTFKYNIKGASKIQVRAENANKSGKKSAINKIFDKYIKKPKSNKNSYIQFTKSTMKKLTNKNNKVTFKIVVYYGKNQSETLTITK